MAVRKITLIGEDVLRREARKVKRFDKTLHRLIDDMVETMREAPGIGLAAPQVGVSQRVIVIELEEDEEDPQSGTLYEFVNPEIVYASEAELEGEEGCLSIPNIVGDVWRSQKVVVKGQNRFGKPQKIEAEEWLARVFQHEIDHLNGVLFLDHVAGPEKLRRLVKVVDENGEEHWKAIPMVEIAEPVGSS
ncbi:MAG: peptide deformylase [Caldilineae bacterium]|nr:peptide deformylase [Anaerolineae bacterium]MCB0203728.1 peptide deformylase [Anaerolineae bacterium]MCB0256909.1 peptide deformylase [Anaerolineae bacterium]MCB9152441.1 peptide deformylase [Caldilineae bacterium]